MSFLSVALCIALLSPFLAWASLPVIDVWNGPSQSFGGIGQPQEWVNVVGKVTDPDGISSLTYSLNGGPELPLTVGPDSLRLWNEGDFNVEIAYRDLALGANTVVIRARDALGNQSAETVTVDYAGVNVWPRTYSIDWSSVASIDDVAQVVDGHWMLEGDSVRTVEMGYDRLIAIGDVTWDNYEVTVPMTVHGLNPICVDDLNGGLCGGGPKVGILGRWFGHFDVDGSQPRWGWQRLGVIGWMAWRSPGLTVDRLMLTDADGIDYVRLPEKDMPFEVPHFLKLRVETDGSGHTFSLKFWPQAEAEPAGWDIVQLQPFKPNVLSQGSLLLLAHHADVSFGDVTVTPIGSDTTAPVIGAVQVAAGQTTATVSWTTDELANGAVDWGPTVAYENGTVTDEFYVSDHRIRLTNLTANTEYHYQITSVDGIGNAANTADLSFTTTSNVAGIRDDQFNAGTLDTALWTFENPAGDSSSVSMTGTQVAISVPAGSIHDMWKNNQLAPRIMQPALDVDFEIEAKFDSPVTQRYQMQGMLIEDNGGNFIRFDFHHDGTTTRVFAATIVNNAGTAMVNLPISSGVPLYLRVKRQGDLWTEAYSYDGTTWTTAGTFSQAMSVTSVGVFAGNSGAPAPAHTALIDYFMPVAPAAITGIWPADAPLGETVSVFVFGENFTTDGSTEVYCNGIRQWLVAPVTTDMLIVRVLVSADLFGPVTVTTPSGSATSTQEFGIPLTGLNLTGIWPSDPKIGEWSSIFLFGTEFTTDGSTEVYFNGARQFLVAPVTSEMLIVRVLGDVSLSGTVTVTTPSGSVSSSEQLIFVP